MLSLLFLHGFATGPSIWDKQVRALSGKYQVSTDLKQIESQVPTYIVAWSMGGFKAIDLWQKYPDKVKGLILVSAFPKYVRSLDYPQGTSVALLDRLEKMFDSDFKHGLHFFYDLIFSNKDQHVLIPDLPEPPREDIDKWFETLRNADKRPLLEKINVPTLIIHGSNDMIVDPTTAQYLHEQIKGSSLRILPDVGHAPFLEQEQVFNDLIIEFVESHKND